MIEQWYLLQIKASVFATELALKLCGNGETFRDLTAVLHCQPPFLCGNGKYYSQLVVATDTHIYACTDNAGDGFGRTCLYNEVTEGNGLCETVASHRPTCDRVHVSVSMNPEVLKPEGVPEGFAVLERISGTHPYFIVRTSLEGYTVAEHNGYKRLVPIYRQNEEGFPTLIGTAWVNYFDNDALKDNKERLVSIEMLGVKLDDTDRDYEYWAAVINTDNKTVLKDDIPETILQDLHWA